MSTKITENTEKIKEKQKQKLMNDEILTQMAIAEIYKETAMGAIRAEKSGALGWTPCPLRKTNKRFLRNTIKTAISFNNRKSDTNRRESVKKLTELVTPTRRMVQRKEESISSGLITIFDSSDSDQEEQSFQNKSIEKKNYQLSSKQNITKFSERKHKFRKPETIKRTI